MSNETNNTIIEIKGQNISYESFGSGPKTLLLIPDAIGTGITDFQSLLEGEDALDGKEYTIIAVEGHGWGRSRPPERKYGADVYNIDCECFHHLMRQLKVNVFSMIGWGEGAKIALLMATKYPKRISSMILIGMSYYNSETAIKHMNSVKNIDNWSEERLECYLKVYENRDEIQKVWKKYTTFFGYYNQYIPMDEFTKWCHMIECPVLLVYGEKDPMTEAKQVTVLTKVIKFSKVHRIGNGEHDIHIKRPLLFKKIIDEFSEYVMLYECSNCSQSVSQYTG